MPTASPVAPILSSRDGIHDFDFLHGAWTVHNRRLLDPLTNSTTWIEFDGSSRVTPLWNGHAHIEEWEADAPSGHISAVSLHLYNPIAQQWGLHWATKSSGQIGVPVIGSFIGSRGEFFAHEPFEGRMILLRIVWESIGATSCRFEQAFSLDGGRTWEVNWMMAFERTS